MLHKAGKDLLKSMRHICSGINGICRLQSERSEHENVRNEKRRAGYLALLLESLGSACVCCPRQVFKDGTFEAHCWTF